MDIKSYRMLLRSFNNKLTTELLFHLRCIELAYRSRLW